MVKASEKLAVLSAEAPINSPLMTDGAAFYQLQEEMRAAFETTVTDLPRAMLVAHPHLVSEVGTVVVVTELTLAAARDSIRLLSWFKTHAPGAQVFVVANRVHPATLEISRKDFEGSIERRIDYIVPFDQKLAAQAAKLGKPLVEAGKGSKTAAPLIDLSRALVAACDGGGDAGPVPGKPGRRARKGGGSLIGRFGEIRGLMPRRGRK